MFKNNKWSKKLTIIPTTIFVAGILSFSCCPLSSITSPQPVINEENCIPYWYFEYADNGKTLLGLSPDISLKTICDEGYTTLLIPENVEKIEMGAFAFMFDGWSTIVTQLVLNKKLKYIGDFAFIECYGLRTVLDFTQTNIEYIGKSAFEKCSGITDIKFAHDDPSQDTIVEIDQAAFRYCVGLKSDLVFPSKLQTIGNAAFYGCKFINSLDFSNYKSLPLWLVKSSGIFRECMVGEGSSNTAYIHGWIPIASWNKLFLDHQHTTGSISFAYKYGTSPEDFIYEDGDQQTIITGFQELTKRVDVVTIPSTVTEIKSLSNIKFKARLEFEEGSMLTKVDNNAFENTLFFGNLTLPDSVETIGEKAFYNTDFTGNFVFPSSLKVIDSENGNPIPAIGNYAFCGSKISGIKIASADQLRDSKSFFGKNSFSDCPRLTNYDFTELRELLPTYLDSVAHEDAPFYYPGTVLSLDGNKIANFIISPEHVIEQGRDDYTWESYGFDKNGFYYSGMPNGTHMHFVQNTRITPFTRDQFKYGGNDDILGMTDEAIKDKDNRDCLSIPETTEEQTTAELGKNALKNVLMSTVPKALDKTWILELPFGLTKLGDHCLANNSSSDPNKKFQGLVFDNTLPETLLEINDPFGDYNNCIVGFLTIPNSVVTVNGFGLRGTKIRGINIPSTLVNISPSLHRPEESPLFSNELEAIDLTDFDSIDQFNEKASTWCNNLFELGDRTEKTSGVLWVNDNFTDDQVTKLYELFNSTFIRSGEKTLQQRNWQLAREQYHRFK